MMVFEMVSAVIPAKATPDRYLIQLQIANLWGDSRPQGLGKLGKRVVLALERP